MDSATIQKIVEIAQTGILNMADGQFVTRQVFNPPVPDEFQVETLKIATLSGFAEFCNTQERPDGALIEISGPWSVRLLSGIAGVRRRRDVYVAATFDDGTIFDFGEFIGQEEFVIALQTKFRPGSDRDRVIQVVGTLKQEAVRTSLDDGRTQKVTASAGITLKEEVDLPNPVALMPYRTFNEVDQPSSLFVLRAKTSRQGETPELALFEADNGAWQREAIAFIRNYLAAQIVGIPIIA